MSKLTKVIKVNEDIRDLVQRLWLDYYQKERVLKGLIEDHQYDKDPTEFLESSIFKAYEAKTSKALFEYETATETMKDTYLPDEFTKIESFKWELDYDSCNLTFTQA